MATKKANPAYRKTTRNGIPVYVSTTTGRVVKGPAGVKRSVKKLAGAVKRTVRRAVKVGVKRVKSAIKRNPSTYVTLDTARSKGAAYAKQGLTKQSAWEKFIAWSRIRSFSPPLPADSHKRLRIKEEFVKAWEGAVKNPKSSSGSKTYKLVWSPTGQKIGTVTATSMKAAIRKAPAPYKKYLGEIYAVEASKNPKAKKVGRTSLAPLNGTAVGKSAYKTTMTAAAKLMPFPAVVKATGRRADGEKVSYYLYVKKNNVAMARKILNGMAKTMTKKATK